MSEDLRLCKDCKWSVKQGRSLACSCPAVAREDRVTGQVKCKKARLGSGACTASGKFFEPSLAFRIWKGDLAARSTGSGQGEEPRTERSDTRAERDMDVGGREL